MDERLHELAAWLSGHESIDWSTIEQELSRPEDRELLRKLRALAELAEPAGMSPARERMDDAEEADAARNASGGSTAVSNASCAATAPLAAFVPPAPLHRFAPGERLGDRYRIVRFLGRGGMGEVYEAHDEELAVRIALKTLRFDMGRDPVALRHMKREVLLARSVAHPSVCRVYDLGRHEEGTNALWFLSMELLHGETLLDRIYGQGRLSPADALPLVVQMAAGLGAAHRAGVVHQDFKSANVMLVDGSVLVGRSTAERAVVMDFGLARMVETTDADTPSFGKTSSVGPRAFIGTPAYMAPEQMLGSVGSAADIYALGVVLYEMVTGKLPFAAKTVLELAVQRLTEDAPSPRREVPALSARWEAVILKCLSRDPADRFTRVEEVASALDERSPVETIAPTSAALYRPRYALPAELDAFVGREREIEEIEGMLARGSRLVTLLGPAGMGKTRLAVRYGWRSLNEPSLRRLAWQGGVWFCDLTEARSLDGIAAAVASSLGVPLGKEDPVQQLGHAIAGHGRCLMLLDNFEQVVEHAQETVARWLDRAPEARFVVTSRERLNLRGEDVQIVEPLAIESGVELFIERARRQRPAFEPGESEPETVREVVQLVEAMPLAIELAAARVRTMTVGQIVERMRERMRVLGGGATGRHASLEVAIDGSWELLAPWEQAAWAQCSVFEGGFTLEAVESVLDLSAWPDAPWIIDVIQSLVDKSLLRMWVPEPDASGTAPKPRFGMYVSLQEYAANKLRTAGAIDADASGSRVAQRAEERHGEYFARFGTEVALDAMDRHGGAAKRKGLHLELKNLVSACRRAISREDGEVAAHAFAASWEVLQLTGPIQVGIELGQEVTSLAGLEPKTRVRALRCFDAALYLGGRSEEARRHCEEAIAIHREVGDRISEGYALAIVGTMHLRRGRVEEARRHYEQSLAIHREVGSRDSEGHILGKLSRLHWTQGRMEEARRAGEEALAIHRDREFGNRLSEGSALADLAVLHHEQGRMEEARLHYDQALAILREVGDLHGEAYILGDLGILHMEQGRMEAAHPCFERALAIHREIGNRPGEGAMLDNLGNLHMEQGRMEAAHPCFERALAIHREVGSREDESITLAGLGSLHILEGRTEEARQHFEQALTIIREIGFRLQEGMVLTRLGNLHMHQSRMEEARQHFEQALAIIREFGNPREEGIVLGALGLLEAREGHFQEARVALSRGETLLREVGDPRALSKLICARGECDRLAHDLAAAHAALAEAEVLAQSVNAGPESELGRELVKLRRALPPRPGNRANLTEQRRRREPRLNGRPFMRRLESGDTSGSSLPSDPATILEARSAVVRSNDAAREL